MFPNLHPWGAYNRITYRFRPYGDRHDMAIMECMYLDPYDGSKAKPPAVPIHWLGVDDDWTEAPELGMLARVFNQDSFNLPKVQTRPARHCRRTSPWPTTRRRRSATSTTS